jgi:zinc transport system permease protein
MLSYTFGRTALVGGVLIAITCSVMSFFIIVRRLAFAGMGISHAAFGGVAIGIASGLNPILTAGAFSAAVACGIGWFSRKGRLHEDTIIGILFSTAMAFGVVLVAAANAYNQDLLSYLFGSILAISWTDVLILAVMSALSVGFLALFFRELLFFSFDEETATASGIPVRTIYYGLLITIALTIVVSIKLVGIILISALIVIPGATGLQMSRNYRRVILFSLVSAVVSVVVGLQLSFSFDVASGATIVLVMFAFFVISVALSPRRSYMRKFLERWEKAPQGETDAPAD